MCQSCTPSLDPNRAEAFAGRMLDLVNAAGAGLLISVGHRVGLFDALAEGPVEDASALAARAGLDQRYVREWVGGMLTARIIESDAEGRLSLPEEHAAFLTRAAGADNIANTTQFIAVLAGVEDKIADCFRRGGGVPYSEFPRFQEVMRTESDHSVVGALESDILPLVPGLIDRLEEGIDVLDVGCGSGHALLRLAERFPRSRFRGVDISPEGIGHGRGEARARGLVNVEFVLEDAAAIRGSYDVVTAFDAIHDQIAPAAVLSAIRGALREDGIFLMQDIGGSSDPTRNLDLPLAPFLYAISTFHCMTVSLAAGGTGLGAMWGEEKAAEMLADAGFAAFEVHQLEHDIMNTYTIAR